MSTPTLKDRFQSSIRLTRKGQRVLRSLLSIREPTQTDNLMEVLASFYNPKSEAHDTSELSLDVHDHLKIEKESIQTRNQQFLCSPPCGDYILGEMRKLFPEWEQFRIAAINVMRWAPPTWQHSAIIFSEAIREQDASVLVAFTGMKDAPAAIWLAAALACIETRCDFLPPIMTHSTREYSHGPIEYAMEATAIRYGADISEPVEIMGIQCEATENSPSVLRAHAVSLILSTPLTDSQRRRGAQQAPLAQIITMLSVVLVTVVECPSINLVGPLKWAQAIVDHHLPALISAPDFAKPLFKALSIVQEKLPAEELTGRVSGIIELIMESPGAQLPAKDHESMRLTISI